VVATGSTDKEQNVDNALSVPLLDACPNPFNPVTTLRVVNVKGGNVKGERFIRIYNIKGELVQDLSKTIHPSPSTFHLSVPWDASGHPSGMYIVQVQTGNRILKKRITLLK